MRNPSPHVFDENMIQLSLCKLVENYCTAIAKG